MPPPPDDHGVTSDRQSHTLQWWVQRAIAAIQAIMAVELAAPPVELQRRLERGVKLSPSDAKDSKIDSHVVSAAISQMTATHLLERTQHKTKGAVTVEVLSISDRYLKETQTDRAIRRKSMLTRRFQGPISSTAGEAGEDVVRHSLKSLPPGVLTPVEAGFAEIRKLGRTTFRGPLDSGAWLVHLGDDGLPSEPTFVPIEVKNRRLSIYPTHKELHQLLFKAATFQVEHPDRTVLPLLVCRHAHWWTFQMAADLGFMVHATKKQYVYASPTVTKANIEEVKVGLQLDDIEVLDRRQPARIITFFESTLPGQARSDKRPVERWRAIAATALSTFDQLRKDDLDPRQRQQIVTDLRDELVKLLDAADLPAAGKWAPTRRDDDDDDEGIEDRGDHFDFWDDDL